MGKIICLDVSQVDDSAYGLLYDKAHPLRKSKADRYGKKDDKVRCIAADALLRYILWKEFSIKTFDIGYEEGGKPYVAGVDNFCFNISHSGKWVVIAYGHSPVGIDIEQMTEKESMEKLAKRYFTEDECEYLLSSPYIERFFEIWTGKESFLKFSGEGLRRPLNSFSVLKLKGNGLKGSVLGEGYYLSYYTKEGESEISFVSPRELLFD